MSGPERDSLALRSRSGTRRLPRTLGRRNLGGLFAWALGALLAALVQTPSPAVAQASAPNIVLIVADDLGYGDLGVYGSAVIDTRSLDGLAAQGMRFTHYHTNSPVCSPTRAALLTGHHPAEFGLREAGGITTEGLPPQVDTLAERLAQNGYATGHFGKWHLGNPSLDNEILISCGEL